MTPVTVKYMRKNLDITKPSYSEQILPPPWPFIKLRFHCRLVLKLSGIFKHSSKKQTAGWTSSLVLDNRLNSTIKSRWRLHNIRERKQLRRRPQRRLQKNNSFNDQNNSSARASRFLFNFLDVHFTATT